MRLITTLTSKSQAERLQAYLKSQSIDNALEEVKNSDWGDSRYGDIAYQLWVYDENDFPKATAIVADFQNSSESQQEKFKIAPKLTVELPASKPSQARIHHMRPSSVDTSPLTGVTLALLILCTLLFLFTALSSTPSGSDKIDSQLPFFYAPLKKSMLFDYPHAFDILDQLIASYGADSLQDTQQLPKSGQQLVAKFNETPYWKGLYDVVLEHLQKPEAGWNFKAPLFEKIREGQIWRLFTPALLHADIFHILFNMIWLVVLGKQMEYRIGPLKLILFVLITALVTNLAQYLVGGPSFLGFSGVLCAMLSFVWMRQRQAAWEGYFLQPSSINFMMVFLALMLLLQTISFYTEASFNTSIAPPIANTAHMSGLVIGALLGRLNFFGPRGSYHKG